GVREHGAVSSGGDSRLALSLCQMPIRSHGSGARALVALVFLLRRPPSQCSSPRRERSMALKGNPNIIDLLNEILTGELTAINQSFSHKKVYKQGDYDRLYEHIYKESIDEMKHSDMLIDRILYLEGLPNVQRLGKVNIGQSVREILTNDLAFEAVAIPLL